MLEQNKIKELQDTLTEIINDAMYHILDEDDSHYLAEGLIEQGYRKSTEVAREIFEELKEKYTECFFDGTKDIIVFRKNDLAELEKKYTESEKDDG